MIWKDNFGNDLAGADMPVNRGHRQAQMPDLISNDGRPYCLVKHERTYPFHGCLVGYFSNLDEVKAVERETHHHYRLFLNGVEKEFVP